MNTRPLDEKRIGVLGKRGRAGGHRTEAADELGIHRSTLWRKMKGYGIEG